MYKSFEKYFCKDERRRLEEEEIVRRHFCFGRRKVIQVDMSKRDELHTITCSYWGCYNHSKKSYHIVCDLEYNLTSITNIT